MKRSLPVIYLAINAACALVVWYAAHRVTALMVLEQRPDSDSVDGITFFLNSAPAFAIAGLTNVAWMGKMLIDLWNRRGRDALVWLGGALVIWGAAIMAGRASSSNTRVPRGGHLAIVEADGPRPSSGHAKP